MKNNKNKISIVWGIVLLFIGASVIPIIQGVIPEATDFSSGINPVEINVQNLGDTTRITYHLNNFNWDVVTIDGIKYNIPLLGKEPSLLEKGYPDLPTIRRSIVIPDTGVLDVRVIDVNYQDIENVLIAPSKGTLSRIVNPDDVGYSFGDVYGNNAWYPSEEVVLGEPYILRDFRGVVVSEYPFQYNPVTKILRFYQDITIEIFVSSPGGINTITREGLPLSVDTDFIDIYQDHFINFGGSKYTPVAEQGKMLVITSDSFWDAMLPFVQWKNTKGVPTEMVRVSTIGNNANTIKSYISSYYTAHGLTFVLLVGDYAQITTFSVLGGGSDPTYSYILGGDHYPDLFVGRFSASTVAQVQTQVLRSVEYEQLPQVGATWYRKGTGIASNEGTGDDNEYDWQHIRNIRTDLLAYTYTDVDEFYDGSHGGGDASGNPTASMVATALNAGRSIINYCGHGSATSWGSTGFSNSNVNTLTNDNMLPFIWSVACVNGDFTHYDACFAEAWLRATHNGEPSGAIGCFMSTINQYWDEPMAAQDEMVDILRESYTLNKKNTFGGLSFSGCMLMNDQYGSSGWDMTDTWHVFGDPSLQVRTNTPSTMTVQHDPVIPAGATTFQVTVVGIKDALCAISKNYVLLGNAYTDMNGHATITFAQPITEGPVTLEVTAYNKIPYSASLEVGSTDVLISGDCYYPNLSPVNTVTVEIINLNTHQRWNASTANNHYFFVLYAGRDVNASQTLRFIARDNDESVNVTDHVVTPAEISARNITLDLVLNVHYRDLTSFPYYVSQIDTGTAVAQMMLNYIWWDSIQNPGGPPLRFPSQQTLFTEFNTQGGLYLNSEEMWQGLNAHAPTPIDEYGYFFNPVNSTNANTVLQSICIWVDYSMDFYNQYHPENPWPKPGYPLHVPVAIPTFGNYNNWMTVRGIHTDSDAWQNYPEFPSVTVYGFWLNDPKQAGIGANTYVTIQTFLSSYFKTINIAGDKYKNQYLAIIEPPQGIPQPNLRPVTLGQTSGGFTNDEAKIISFRQNRNTPLIVKDHVNNILVEKARTAAGNVLKYDRSSLAELLTNAFVVQKPRLNGDAYTIIFENNDTQFTVEIFKNTGVLKQFSVTGP